MNLWQILRSGYWFVPTLMAGGAIGLVLLTSEADQRLGERWVRRSGWFYTGGPEGARSLLSTVASSMITVAGVVFSITIVALTLAASRFGPRLLRNFMRDRGTQVVLGAFITTFICCLLVLRTIRGGDGGFLPHISITVGVGLALASLGG